jgi:hypothetical protein
MVALQMRNISSILATAGMSEGDVWTVRQLVWGAVGLLVLVLFVLWLLFFAAGWGDYWIAKRKRQRERDRRGFDIVEKPKDKT